MYTDPGANLVAAIVSARAIEFLKKSSLPWISEHSVGLNKGIALFLSGASSVGISFQMTGDLFNGGSITMDFQSLSTMFSAAATIGVNWIMSMGIQEFYYQKAVRDPKPEAVTMAGTVSTPAGKPVAHVEMTGISAEAGSEAAKSAASTIDSK